MMSEASARQETTPSVPAPAPGPAAPAPEVPADETPGAAPPHEQATVPFRTAVRAWFGISLQTFGCPAGQIAVMQRELVDHGRGARELCRHALAAVTPNLRIQTAVVDHESPASRRARVLPGRPCARGPT